MTPELLAPAGGFDAALAAFQYGADAIYLGLSRFSARADADNLTPDRLRLLLAYARSFCPPKRVYVTVNTLVEDAELAALIETLDALDALGPDGVIVQDLGVARLIRDHFPRLALHASTQMAVHNTEGAIALRELGFTRVVLARELTLDEIRRIVRDANVEIEIFVHGALCYSISGLCLFSSHMTGRSGNRGRCAYCCREAFTSTDPELQTSDSRPAFPFSMRDLALAPLLDAVAATGVQSLKIEGRMKSPLYVACVTDFYRRKLDGTLTPDAERALVQDVQTIFSRPWTAFYAQGPDAPAVTVIDPVAIGHRGARIGTAEAVIRDRTGTRWLRFTSSRALEKHDGLQVELAAGGKPFGCAVNLLRTAGSTRPAVTLPAGSTMEVALPDEDIPVIPQGTPVYCSSSQAVRRRYALHALREADFDTGHPVDFRVTLSPDGIVARAETHTLASAAPLRAEATLQMALAPSRQPGQTTVAVRKAFARLGGSVWRFGSLDVVDPALLYAPLAALNEARRRVLDRLEVLWNTDHAARRAAIADTWGLPSAKQPPAPPEPASCAVQHPTFAASPSPVPTPASQAAGLPVEASLPTWTLKLRIDAPPPSSEALRGFSHIVLAIGHTDDDTLGRSLNAWCALTDRSRLRLALPPLTRIREWAPLASTVRTLHDAGWNDWECADLAGLRLLTEEGQSPVSADWSLYALNRVALAELGRLGVRQAVFSPEAGRDTLRALCHAQVPAISLPVLETLVYQHTPLFISATAPCLSTDADTSPSGGLHLTDRRGRDFRVLHLDNRWITVAERAFCVAERTPEYPTRRFRVDLSWSPDTAWDDSLLTALRSGEPIPNTHRANTDRGFR
ncbi:MAG TPA: peptidase U32 family protein [Kiritimatiellia bacterium]|nr:MAG: putative protease YhbU precursor [Verrucomicrobia bacterium ADurb.Bin070]HQQ91351.1 peptidase U32 family protein [Kiritimatiellia bacterium]